MTYNLLVSGRGRTETIARIVEACRPDVLAVQEATDPAAIRGLARRWGMQIHVGHSATGFGVALLSPHPLEPEPIDPAPGRLAKSLARARIHLPDRGDLSVVATHLAAYPWHRLGAPAWRRAELAEVLRLSAGADLILADCNARAPGDPLRPIPRPRGMHGPYPSYPNLLNRAILVAAQIRGCRPLMRLLIEAEIPREMVGMLLKAGWVDVFRHLHPLRPAQRDPDLLVDNPAACHPRPVHAGRAETTGRDTACEPDQATPEVTRGGGEAWARALVAALRPLRPLHRLDCGRVGPRALGYTWPVPWPLARIDFVFASPQLARRAVACEPVNHPDVCRGSDHLPVTADFG